MQPATDAARTLGGDRPPAHASRCPVTWASLARHLGIIGRHAEKWPVMRLRWSVTPEVAPSRGRIGASRRAVARHMGVIGASREHHWPSRAEKRPVTRRRGSSRGEAAHRAAALGRHAEHLPVTWADWPSRGHHWRVTRANWTVTPSSAPSPGHYWTVTWPPWPVTRAELERDAKRWTLTRASLDRHAKKWRIARLRWSVTRSTCRLRGPIGRHMAALERHTGRIGPSRRAVDRHTGVIGPSRRALDRHTGVIGPSREAVARHAEKWRITRPLESVTPSTCRLRGPHWPSPTASLARHTERWNRHARGEGCS
jgi:hypothetical protein